MLNVHGLMGIGLPFMSVELIATLTQYYYNKKVRICLGR